MKQIRYDSRVSMVLIFASLILCLMCLMVIMWFKTGEEASVGIFSLAVTLIGTMFIAIELKNSQNVTCSDMLIDLNNYFHDSDRLMKVYEALEENDLHPDETERIWRDVKGVEVAQYCTFFENLYLLYRHHIAEIEDLDDLFGYRFFLFMNNPYIQENYILPTSSSYVQIFELYKAWITYRDKVNRESKDGERRVPGVENRFSKEYLDNKMYMHDTAGTSNEKPVQFEERGKKFTLRRLGFQDLSEIMRLQAIVVDALPDKSLYFPLTRDELLESLHLDILEGIFNDKSELIAFSLTVAPRNGNRNLAASLSVNPTETLTFDVVMVHPHWRGFGFQRLLVKHSVESMNSTVAIRILATVAPDNRHSLDNFLAVGFRIADTQTKYSGLTRHILEYQK